MIKRLVFIFLTVPAMAVAQDSLQILTLDEVMSIALDNNFSIKLAKNDLEIAGNNNSYGNAGFLPVLDAGASYDRNSQNTTQEFASGDIQRRTGAGRQNLGANLALTWTLFDGTRMFATKQRLTNEEVMAQQQLKIQVDNSLAQLMATFYQLAFEIVGIQLLESNIEFSDDRMKIVEDKYILGKESKMALLQAQVDLNSDKSVLANQQEILVALKLQLIHQMGVDPFDYEIDFSVDIDTSLNVDELLEAANRNPTMMSLFANQEILKNQSQEINRGRWPVLDLNLGYGYTNLEAEAGFLKFNETSDLRYGLSARVNLFDGLNRQRELENARISMESGAIQTEQALSQIQTSILSTFTSYRNNLELIELERENLNVAEENSQIALERFRLGSSNPLELREAQINAVNAELRFLRANLNAKLAEIELYRLTGQISTLE